VAAEAEKARPTAASQQALGTWSLPAIRGIIGAESGAQSGYFMNHPQV
jgi:hypothetical protein